MEKRPAALQKYFSPLKKTSLPVTDAEFMRLEEGKAVGIL
jgi:hypothetical protein